MDPNEAYTNARLLYKCDRSIANIYCKYLQFLHANQANGPTKNSEILSDNDLEAQKNQLLKQIDTVSFQNFKYKTALLSIQKDHKINEQAHERLKQTIDTTKQYILQLTTQHKQAEQIRQRKQQFLILLDQLKAYRNLKQLNSTIAQVQSQIAGLTEKYEAQIRDFVNKQRLLRIGIGAIRRFLSGQNGTVDSSSIDAQNHGSSSNY